MMDTKVVELLDAVREEIRRQPLEAGEEIVTQAILVLLLEARLLRERVQCGSASGGVRELCRLLKAELAQGTSFAVGVITQGTQPASPHNRHFLRITDRGAKERLQAAIGDIEAMSLL